MLNFVISESLYVQYVTALLLDNCRVNISTEVAYSKQPCQASLIDMLKSQHANTVYMVIPKGLILYAILQY